MKLLSLQGTKPRAKARTAMLAAATATALATGALAAPAAQAGTVTITDGTCHFTYDAADRKAIDEGIKDLGVKLEEVLSAQNAHTAKLYKEIHAADQFTKVAKRIELQAHLHNLGHSFPFAALAAYGFDFRHPDFPAQLDQAEAKKSMLQYAGNELMFELYVMQGFKFFENFTGENPKDRNALQSALNKSTYKNVLRNYAKLYQACADGKEQQVGLGDTNPVGEIIDGSLSGSLGNQSAGLSSEAENGTNPGLIAGIVALLAVLIGGLAAAAPQIIAALQR